jgi:hypothetical protein
MRRYKPLLDELLRQLGMERTKYVSTCREIFGEDFPFDLLSEPASDIWNSEAVQARLGSRLHPTHVGQFVGAAESLNSALEKLRKKFPKDDPVRTQLFGMSACELTLAQLRQRFFKRVLMRLNLAMLEAYRHKELVRIRNINNDLSTLLNAGVVEGNPRSQFEAEIPLELGDNYDGVRTHAAELFGVLRENLANRGCNCLTPHEVGLQLEARPNDITEELNTNPHFKCVFPFDCEQGDIPSWEIELERLDSAAVGPEESGRAVGVPQVRSVGLATGPGYRSVVPGVGQVIKDLCREVRSDDSDGSRLGVLVDHTQRPFRARSTPRQPVFYHTVSLHSLLTRESSLVGRYDRLLLGVKLASSVIQLYNTGWITEDWDSRSIPFLDGGDGVRIDTPLVRSSFRGDSSDRAKPGLRRRNRSLFSLGIALLELWYATPMEVLREKAAQEFDEPDISVSEAAEQFIEWLYRDAGRRYADAVRRCVLCLDHRDTDFGSDEFKEEFRQHILLPLEDNVLFYNDF